MAERLWQLFDEDCEYPDLEYIAENGVEQNVFYSYVSNSYLDGIVNGVDFFKAYVIERYEPFDEELPNIIDEYTKAIHSKFGIFGNDVFLLGETSNSYWLFWYDMDVSDCCVGRFEKSRVKDKEEFVEIWKEWMEGWIKESGASKPTESTEIITGEYIEIPIPKGWKSF